MMTILALLLAVVGFVLLALSLPKHHRDLLGTMPSRTVERAFRASGWLLLGTSLLTCIATSGVSIGLVLWTAVLTVAAIAVVLLITYQDLWRRA